MGSLKRSESGVTLVELLVAVSILMVISVTLFSAFETATRSWERGAGDGAMESALRLALHEFDAQARSAVDEMLIVDARPVPYFFGSTDTLQFLTNGAGALFGEFDPGTLEVTWRIERDDLTDEPGLVIERALPEDLQPEDERISEIVKIAPGVSHLRFRYHYRPPLPETEEESIEGLWTDEWDPLSDDLTLQPQRMPEGVEITVGHFDETSGDTLSLPSIYVPILVKTDLLRASGAEFGSLDGIMDFQ